MLRRFFAFLCAAFAVISCTSQPAVKQPSVPALVTVLNHQTVALYSLSQSNHPKCTGVWVSGDTFITASHCIEIGEALQYSTDVEYRGVFTRPQYLHQARLVKADLFHDLALYRSGLDMPDHLTANVASYRPEVGEGLYFVGNPAGLVWSFRRGVVSSFREIQFEDDWVGPWMQASAPIYLGDSGGGAFDEDGQLVGIVHAIATEIPNVAFCVPLETIREFLK